MFILLANDFLQPFVGHIEWLFVDFFLIIDLRGNLYQKLREFSGIGVQYYVFGTATQLQYNKQIYLSLTLLKQNDSKIISVNIKMIGLFSFNLYTYLKI